MTRSSNSYFNKKAQHIAGELGINLIIASPDQIDLPLESYLKNSANVLPRPKETILWNRIAGSSYDDYDLLITRNWQQLGAKTVNKIDAHQIYRDKFLQYLHLKNNNIPVVETYYLPNGQTSLLDHQGPFVAKTLRGAQGKGVIRLEDKSALEDFLALSKAISDSRFIIQPFIEYPREHRVLVLKGEIVAHLIKDKTQEHWKHNGNHAVWREGGKLNDSVYSVVNKITSLEEKFFYAIDFISDDDKFVVLEVNLCPGVEKAEATLGKSLIRELLSVI